MKLNIYANQTGIEKTYEVQSYDIMYGTIEDIFGVLDELTDNSTEIDIMKIIQRNYKKLNNLLLDIFSSEGLTEEELKRIKVKELIPVFLELINYVKGSFPTKN